MPLFKNTGPLVRLWAALNGAMYIVVIGVMYFVSSELDKPERVAAYVTMALFGILGLALLWRAAVGFKTSDVSHKHSRLRPRRPLSDFERPLE